MNEKRRWYASPVAIAFVITGCILGAAIWINHPVDVLVLHPTGVSSITVFNHQFSGEVHGIVPMKSGGAFFYDDAVSQARRDIDGFYAGVVSASGAFSEYQIETSGNVQAVAPTRGRDLVGAVILDEGASLSFHGAVVRILDARRTVPWLKVRPSLGDIEGVAIAPDDAVWVTLPSAHAVARIGAREVLRTTVLARNLYPTDAVFDSTGRLYVSSISRESRRPDTIVRFPLGAQCCGRTLSISTRLGHMAPGRDGDVWFVDLEQNQIRHIQRSGSIESFHAGPRRLTAGIAVQRDAVWFAVQGGVGRMDIATHARTIYNLPDNDEVVSLAAGARDVWGAAIRQSSWCFSECSAIVHIAL